MKVEFELSEHRVLVAAACGLVGLFAVHAAFPSLYDFWPKSSSELADWVQAVGSIAAIVGAVWATHYQLSASTRRAEIEASNRRVEMAGVVAQSCHAAHVLIRTTYRCIMKADKFGWYLPKLVTRLESTEEMIDLVLSKDLPGALFEPLIAVRVSMDLALRAVANSQTPQVRDQTLAENDIRSARHNVVLARWRVRSFRKAERKQNQTLRGL